MQVKRTLRQTVFLVGLLLPGPYDVHLARDQNAPKLRVTTHLVQVNLIALDNQGRGVSDLTRENLTVFDNGEPQQISMFRMESNVATAAAAEALAPGTFSNRLDQQAHSTPNVTVILLDGLNTRWADQSASRLQAIKFLQRQIQADDHIALYTLAGNLSVRHDFSSDARSLLHSLQSYSGSLWLAPGAEVTGPEAVYFAEVRIKRTADALEAIANHLVRIPGRKNLIWVSGSIPIRIGFDLSIIPGEGSHRTEGSFQPELERAARALNNANLAVYWVDARGLIAEPAYSAEHQSIPTRAAPPLVSFSAAQELTELTGGRAFYNTNDIEGALRRVIDDSRLTYVLGYYPTHNQWNGEFRKIKVRVNRPGLRLYYRRGYAALPEVPSVPQEREDSLAAAAWSPLEATGLGLTVRAARVPDQDGLKLEIQAGPQDLTLHERDGRWEGSLTLLAIQLSTEGFKLRATSQNLRVHLTPEMRSDVLGGGLRFKEHLELVPKADHVRVILRDDPSGVLGSVNIPLDEVVRSLVQTEGDH